MTGRFAVAILTVLLVLVPCANVLPASNPPDGVVHELFRQPLPDKPGTDVVVLTVDYPPGGATPPHEHPGFTYAHVLQGAVVSQVDAAKPRTYTQGQMWSERPHHHHVVSKNASSGRPATLLVFMIVPHGAQLITMLPASTR